jgi:uncharacterized protein involved in outer membrane biogenesis
MAENKELTPESMKDRPAWKRWLLNRWTIAVGLTLLGYTLAGFLLTPWLLHRYLPSYVDQQLGHRLNLGQVRINPFLFTLEVKDFRLEDGEGELLLEYGRLLVDFELESIVRWAWTFADITLETPTLHLVLDQAGRLNLDKLLEKLPAKADSPEQNKEDQPVRLLFKRFALTGGSLHFSDHSGPLPVMTKVTPVAIELSGISTLLEHNGFYSVNATLPLEGRLVWQGEASLAPLASRGTLIINDFQTGVIWEFFQENFKLARPEGHAHLSLDYRFSHAAGRTDFVVHPLMFRLDDLVVREKEREFPLLQLASLEVSDVRFDLARRELRLPSVVLRRGGFSAELGQDGLLDWQRLNLPVESKSAGVPVEAVSLEGDGKGEAVPEQEAPWRLKVDAFSMAELALHFSDQSRGTPVSLEIEDIALTLAAEAEVGAGPPGLQVKDLALLLRGISSREKAEDKPLWRLAEARLDGGSFELADRQVQVSSVILEGGQAEVLRNAAGTIRQLEVYGTGVQEPAAQSAESPTGSSSPDWRFQVARFELVDFDLDYVDQGFSPALQYDLRDLAMVAEGLDTASTEPVRYSARTQVAQGGSVEAEGSLAKTGEELSSRIKIDGLNLTPLEPVLSEYVLLRLAAGNLSLDSRISYLVDRSGQAGPNLEVKGSFGINDLLLEESTGGERFLAWRDLTVNDIDFSLAPASLAIAEIKVLEPEAKIVIHEDGSINLARIINEQAQPATPEASPAPADMAGQEPFPLQLERVRLENGVVEFADLSLVLPFSARIEKFGGTALNISGDPAARATLKFRGLVDQYGQAEVDGTLSPLDPRHFVDIQVIFRNVELLPISPYTATFAGRRVASGRLDLDLSYKIADSELLGDHRVVLRNFSLGERVESPNALSLPLDLAIALLTDREGKIDVEVPVRGNLDNPEFSYGHVIWQAVRNLLTRIVTAPFQALSSLFGSGSEQPDRILFEPGQAEPAPPEREKLRQVAEVLNQRPQLNLTVHGTFARDLDGRSLRDLAVRRSLAALLGVALQPGEDPGPVAFDHAKTQRFLEELAGGSKPMAEFQATYEGAAGVKARRVNPALALFGKGSADLEFYRALFRHLVEIAPLAEEELQSLAAARRDEVIRELRDGTGLAPERLVAGPLAETEGEQAVSITLELGVGMAGTK